MPQLPKTTETKLAFTVYKPVALISASCQQERNLLSFCSFRTLYKSILQIHHWLSSGNPITRPTRVPKFHTD